MILRIYNVISIMLSTVVATAIVMFTFFSQPNNVVYSISASVVLLIINIIIADFKHKSVVILNVSSLIIFLSFSFFLLSQILHIVQ
jgi:hypothetical protein